MKINIESSGFTWFYRILDLILPFFMLMVLINAIGGIVLHTGYTFMGFLGGVVMVITAQLMGIYSGWRARPITKSAQLISKAWLLSWGFLVVVAFLAKDAEDFSRLIIFLWAVVTPLTLIGYRALARLLMRRYYSQASNRKKVAIIGASKSGQNLASVIRKNPWLSYRLVGFYDDDPELQNTLIDDIPVLGTSEQAYLDAKQNNFQRVYICLPMREEEKIKTILNKLTDTTAIVKYIPDLFACDLMHAKWSDLQGIPVISVFDSPLNSNTARLLKRIEDIVLSSLILLMISPIMIALAVGVKATSPGPVFYRQTRVSWNGGHFGMLKFRSMPVDTEKHGVKWGSATSKTNTKFGQFIRSTSLDELPQFLNVLLGDMSIVGPRPERDIFVEQFRKEIPRYMQKHMVKAGITGWAQIHGWRGDTSLEKRIEFDIHYINHWTLWLDIKIIFLTIFKGFINKNAR